MAKGDAGSRAGGQVSAFEALEGDDPEQLGGYTLAARLGAGGMGKVYLSHTLAGRPVAIKMIRPELADDPDFRRRFRREVAAARRVHGLFTAPVIDSEIDAPPLWLATAFVEGPTLSAAVSRHGTLPVPAVLLLAAGVAEALQAVHGEGIVHRDLKASNVLLASDGPRVIDFGISRAADSTALTSTGVAVGTPPFMSPEQALNEEAGPATDIFSLGQLVTYAVKGTPAFGGGQTYGVLYRIVHEEPDLSDVPEELLPLLNRCLTKDPDERPSPAEVIGLCRAASEGGMLRRTGNWLPAAVTADITRHQDTLPQPRAGGQPSEDAAEPVRTGSRSPESNGAAPAGPAMNEEPGPNDVADPDDPDGAETGVHGAAPGPPPVPSAGHSGISGTNHPPTGAPPPGVEENDLVHPADPADPADPAEFRVLEPAGSLKFTYRAAPDSPGRSHDAAGTEDSGRPTGDGEVEITLGRPGPAAGTGRRRAPAGPRRAARKTVPRRAVIGLGATALAGAGTAAVFGLREDSDNKKPQRPQRVGPKKITMRTASVLRFPDWVWSVAFSEDSGTLAIGNSDNDIRLVNAETGKTEDTFTGHTDTVCSVAFSRSGKSLASSSADTTVRLWEVATAKSTRTLTGHTSTVRSVAFSPNGELLASACDDTTVRLWEVATGKNTDTLTGHSAVVHSVAFSPDGKTLATGSSDKTVRLWDVATGKRTGTLGHREYVNSVAFSPDGKYLATGSGDNTVRLWDIATGKISKSLDGHTWVVYSVAFSPDGKTLATGSGDNTVRLWDVATGRNAAVLKGHKENINSVALSPDGKVLAAGSDDNTARLWKASGNARISAAKIDR